MIFFSKCMEIILVNNSNKKSFCFCIQSYSCLIRNCISTQILKGKGGGSRGGLFSFIPVASGNSLSYFLCTGLLRPCQKRLQTTHFLFRKCTLNGLSIWSFVWIKFSIVPALVSFHLESGRKEVTEGKTTKLHILCLCPFPSPQLKQTMN